MRGIHRPGMPAFARLTPNAGNQVILSPTRIASLRRWRVAFVGPAIADVLVTAPAGVLFSTAPLFEVQGTQPGTWSYAAGGGAWPAWLTVNPASGEVSGVSEVGEWAELEVVATYGGKSAVSNRFAVEVVA